MDDPTPRSKESKAAYAVGTPPEPGAPATTYALFFTHGMGQPIPFQTIDQVANSLRDLDNELGHQNPKPVGRTIKSGEDWLNRIELRLKSAEEAVEVHLYEGYWAPMTEGRIKSRDVISFLAGAGFNGLRNTSGKFRRWLFGKFPELPIPVRTVMFLLIALATVAALVIMNATIAIVAAARALLGEKPAWLSDNLFADLTTTFNIVVMVMGAFGLSLAIAVAMRKYRAPKWIRHWWSVVTLVLFVVALFVVSLSGLAIPSLFYGHVRGLAGMWPLWYQVVDSGLVDRFNDTFDSVAWWSALALALIVAGRWLWRILKGLARDLEDKKRAPLTLAVALVFFALLGSLIAVGFFFYRTFAANDPDGAAFAKRAVAWPLLVAVSAYIRLVLVQYLGDVAIYIMPYKLDAFNDLRREIKQRVYSVAKAVYAHKKPYDRIIVVGHSLGSVITYDALNMLVLEDQSDVVSRTPLFLTFGSPLDKTAFIFAAQGRGTSEAREALAGSVQPLIVDYKFRPKRWVNVWSPWDIISGSLDLYDLPIEMHESPATLKQRVVNVRDEEATTLLIAHTEYWKNPLVVKKIYDEIKAL